MYQNNRPVRIMCIGDSITAGAGSLSAWRYYIFEKLYSAGANFRLVGCYKSKSDYRLPEGYNMHCAVGGYTIGYSDSPEKLTEREKSAQQGNALAHCDNYLKTDFDVVCIMLGANDFCLHKKNSVRFKIEASLDNYRAILDKVFAKNPTARVYLSTCCPMRTNADRQKDMLLVGINPYLPSLVKEYADMGFDIKFVNNCDEKYPWSTDCFTSVDNMHPNEYGRSLIAAAFFDAMNQGNDIIELGKRLEADGDTFEFDQIVHVDEIKTDISEIALECGTAKTAKATAYPENANIRTILWTSDNDGVASVSKYNGRITGVGVGNATVYAHSLDGNHTATIKVTVKSSSDIPAAKIVFEDDFDNLSRWVQSDGSKLFVRRNCCTAHARWDGKNYIHEMHTVDSFDLSGGFEISCILGSSNDLVNKESLYSSLSACGLEVRFVDGARIVTLLQNGERIAQYNGFLDLTGDSEIRFCCHDGRATVCYDKETLIDCNIKPFGNKSDVKFHTTSFGVFPHLSKFKLMSF